MCTALTNKNLYCNNTPHYAILQEKQVASLNKDHDRGGAFLYCLLHAKILKKRHDDRGGIWVGHEIYRWLPHSEWGKTGMWEKV